MRKNRAYISIGSNIENRLYYHLYSMVKINEVEKTSIKKISNFYETEPWGLKNQADFLNCVIEVETEFLPFQLLRELQKIELDLKRVRLKKWGPRTIDLDIILYEDLEIETNELKIPHPHYKNRNFVLIPLMDIHPNRDKFVKELKNSSEEVKSFSYEKPLLISSCILGEKCTYRGTDNKNNLLNLLRDKFNILEICPEVEGGLSTPRIPAERVGEKVVDREGKDVTKEFLKGALKSLEIAKEKGAEIALMKSLSPSCGKDFIYDGSFLGQKIAGDGLTVEKLEEEGILVIPVDRER